MPAISLMIPFRDDGTRVEQMRWLTERWAAHFPEAEVIIEGDDGKDPFSKTIAVNRCYRRTTSDVLAIIDADVWIEPEVLLKAASEVRGAPSTWVRPCDRVMRLSRPTTQMLVQSDPSSAFPELTEADCERITPTVGLACVFSRSMFEAVGGMDPRFRGWGWEDNAWIYLLTSLAGPATVMDNFVFHLWHPRAHHPDGRPAWSGQTTSNIELGLRYKRARKNRSALDALIREVRARTGIAPVL